jgi:hypothetical protein
VPGKSVKNWRQYHALRRKGYSKTSAARITNAAQRKRRTRRTRRRRRR